MSELNITTALTEVQTAVYTVLTGDAAHMALLAGKGVYDYVPDNADYPYQVIGEINETAADTFDTGFREVTATVHTWSRAKGNKEANAIQASAIKLLHRKTLPLPTLHCVSCRLDYNDILPDPDGLTRHGVTRYLIKVQATS